MAEKTGSAAAEVVPALFYDDPNAALDWLEQAFGFETCLRVTDDDGVIQHAELEHGNGRIMLGGSGWAEFPASPKTLGGRNTQCIHVQVKDVMAHYERAKAAGATIAAEPEDQFYGDKVYRAFDLEGHFWTFGQTMRVLSNADMEKASPGLKVEGKG
ncbi:VOC family protein [Parvibaculum sp.]|uniref:VOC family protein n=1 Tax=Parvibaculum sp. TaxID=2024848 RepID=UPI001B288275|nr:VOC family protein [Parvibaculum sp.]MBO6634086.1 VOC family protein [Parvibaculum sp.]MBO6679834.1 VOC family protein [Parvibaculum sp.]MBO6683805.1 VOC family protein [Parvibaculum sp.]MBO6905914.1 VOC family protein [Parvibaculum sp.]